LRHTSGLMSMLLHVNNITVHYGTAEAVKDVTLTVSDGAVVTVIGANGSGKSSILKAITGLAPLTSGSIRLRDEKIDGLPAHEIVRLGIALVPEGRRPFPYLSVLSNLRLGAYAQKDKVRVERQLEEIFVRFPVLRRRCRQQAGTLSGGEQQMLVIGRALMAGPKLLLMDEPSVGLAPIVINGLAEVIKDIHGNGISVLLVEQNASLVTRVSTQGYVLEVGKVVLEGNIKELMANDLVRRAFLGA
jgi:branched-chain amino acid transport system ATP-binding protein